MGVRTREDGAEELERADVHALLSTEFYPEASGDDEVILYVDNLLGTRPGALVTVRSRPYYILPRTHQAMVQDGPTSVTYVCLKRPITKITRTAVAERNPEVRNTYLER